MIAVTRSHGLVRLGAALLWCSPFAVSHAQAHAHGPPSAAPTDSLPLYDALGHYSRTLSRPSPAQPWFDQGMRLSYAFGHGTAVRSFRSGIARDSSCAMCWWGIAWARGPYINNPTPDSAPLVEAYRAIQEAQRRSAGVSPVERALIDALATRYAEVPTAANRAVLDSAYARAMTEVARRFPQDDDVGALLGEARMMLRPWRLYTREKALEPGTAEALAALETVLRRNVRHPGACHLYIHATEAGPTPERAVPCAEGLGDGMPGASHMVHMASHTWHRVGRWGDAVRANQRAIIADEHGRAGGVPGVYPMHNVQMLLGGALMDGQRAVALDAARIVDRAGPGDQALTMAVLARFGRWSELRGMTFSIGDRVTTAWAAATQGLAWLDTARTARATEQLGVVDAVLAGTPDSAAVGGLKDRHLIELARGILAGELLAARGQVDSAVTALTRAVAFDDSLPYQEHITWSIPPRHVLAGVLLDAGRATEAERVLREDLARHPNNGWALLGLAQALEAQQRTAEAVATREAFRQAWARADVWIAGPRVRPGAARAQAAQTTGR
ncbi:MAG: tetratricopeptide repeat protein [Gemmatimonadaceae bacterium]|jgi:tetratricopeptide (TPR) repeat protein|nr:tetratricopeptide repeat protein [Gemmatimonadaceae bacterium]